MKGFILVITLFLTASNCYPQTRNLAKLVSTEKEFAALSVTKNTKEAFLAFSTDDGLIFRKGQPLNCKENWNKRIADSSELWWQPSFADISSDGTLGFTTGPWTYKKLKSDSIPVGYGNYFTIWQKQKDGEFKWVIDIGISHGPANYINNKDILVASDIFEAKNEYPENKLQELSAIKELEEQFVSAYKSKGYSVYNDYVMLQSMIYRPGELPFLNIDSLENFMTKQNEKLFFEIKDGKIASSGDWGYMYGNVKIETVNEKGSQSYDGNYLHVWRKNKKGNWRLIAEVVTK